MDSAANNYNAEATEDDGSCTYANPDPDPDPNPEPEPEPEPVPEPTCVDGETRPADDDCNDCVCGGGEWACTEMACNPVDGDSSSSSSGGMTTSQMVRVVLGVLSLIAGVFLITLLIRVRDQEDEGKFE